jgi:hypothetical protein
MALRVRFGTSNFLWAMLVLALCFGWMADHAYLQHQINFMVKYDEMQSKKFEEMDDQLQYVLKKYESHWKPYLMNQPAAATQP